MAAITRARPLAGEGLAQDPGGLRRRRPRPGRPLVSRIRISTARHPTPGGAPTANDDPLRPPGFASGRAPAHGASGLGVAFFAPSSSCHAWRSARSRAFVSGCSAESSRRSPTSSFRLYSSTVAVLVELDELPVSGADGAARSPGAPVVVGKVPVERLAVQGVASRAAGAPGCARPRAAPGAAAARRAPARWGRRPCSPPGPTEVEPGAGHPGGADDQRHPDPSLVAPALARRAGGGWRWGRSAGRGC